MSSASENQSPTPSEKKEEKKCNEKDLVVFADNGRCFLKRINSLTEIPKKYHLLGSCGQWFAPCEKDKYKIGDVVAVFILDTIFPQEGPFPENICGMKVKNMNFGKKKHVNSVFFPEQLIRDYYKIPDTVKEGDITSYITGLKKTVESSEEKKLYTPGDSEKVFPPCAHKTDVSRDNFLLNYCIKTPIIITEKKNGTSSQAGIVGGDFIALSRNFRIFRSKRSQTYFDMFDALKLEDKLKDLPEGLFLQGEIVGPGVNANKHKLTKTKFFLYNIFDSKKQQFLSHNEICDISTKLELDVVPMLFKGTIGDFIEKHSSLEEFALSLDSNSPEYMEGIVAKTLCNEVSAKIICVELNKKSKKSKKSMK